MSKGASSWFPNVSTSREKSYWIFFALKICLSQKVKIIKEFGQALDVAQKPFKWWVGFNEDDLEIFRPKVQEILNFE